MDTKAAWSSAYITALPDSAFACIDSSGRHYPHHDASGNVDLPHLRAALSRLGSPDNTQCGAAHLRAHAKALGVGDAMKAEQLSSTKWRVLAIPFGGPFKGGKDLDHEYFSPRTDIKADWFDRRPVLFHHAKDELIGDETLGTEDDLEQKSDGWWATVWLERSNRYWDMVNGLLSAGKMYGSSGALAHVVKKARDGELLVWPHIEQTLTPIPSNFLSRVEPAKALEAFTSAGISVDAYKALFESDPDLRPDLPEGGEDVARARLLARLSAQEAQLKTLR